MEGYVFGLIDIKGWKQPFWVVLLWKYSELLVPWKLPFGTPQVEMHGLKGWKLTSVWRLNG